MSVISIETRKANELAATSNIGDSSIFMVHDGTGLKRITFEDVKRAMVYPNAGSHNTIYRGKSLGSTVTPSQYASITNSTFDDLFIGDYWTINNINYRIAAFDYFYNTGDTLCTTHHVVIVPDQCLYNGKMNDANTTQGGYAGSAMHRSGLENAKSRIRSAFANHVMNHRMYFTNAVSNNYISGGAWFDSDVDLMSEQMVYGGLIFMPTSNGAVIPPNYRVDKSQLPLFQYNHSLISNGSAWWLRDVVSGNQFSCMYIYGNPTCDPANYEYGVRPFFCIS